MNILIAPNNFKESISAPDAAEAIENGIKSLSSQVNTVCLPLSDGGEGFVDALVNATGGSKINCKVQDPLNRRIDSYYGKIQEDTAVLEMALASGLELITEEEKNPWLTTSYGTGQLISHAIKMGFSKIILGIGGSATNDAGMGVLQALGVNFFESTRKEVLGHGAQYLDLIKSIHTEKLKKLIQGISVTVACDVTNPLLGINGATNVYGPQKGGDPEILRKLESSIQHFHEVTIKNLSIDKGNQPGAGAAGGVGYAMMTYLNAKMEPGFDIVSRYTDLEEKVKWADLIITGEGKIDQQTAQGKVIARLGEYSKNYGKRLHVIAGIAEIDVQIKGVNSITQIINRSMGREDSMKNAKIYLQEIGREILEMTGN